MRYTVKSGVLYEEQSCQTLAKIKSSLTGPVKKIFRNSDEPVLKTDIRHLNTEKYDSGDVRCREYILINREDEMIAAARPGYAEGNDPAVTGWPICRMPKVDHAQITIKGEIYYLTMHNSQNYALKDSKGHEILRIMHKGITGGWSVEDDQGFTPEILWGLFIFCRYIQQENEFLIL